MSKYEKLVALRKKYPITTSAAHFLVMKAADLKRSTVHKNWIRVDGVCKAELAFEAGLQETIDSAALETGLDDPEELLKFTAGYFAQFALACPGWNDVLPEIVDGLYKKRSGQYAPFSLAIDRAAEPKQLSYITFTY